MDADTASVSKFSATETPTMHAEELLANARTVAFPNEQDDIYEEKIHHGHMRPKGVEMKREMTKEDMELAAAGYEHLQEHKGKKDELDGVDVNEHHLSFDELGKALDSSIDTKDPGASHGLTSEEAKQRLARNGPNILTPPKKKSALRKVRRSSCRRLTER